MAEIANRLVGSVLAFAIVGAVNAAESTATATLGGTAYRVPVGYLGYPQKPSDKDLLVYALLPDMQELGDAPANLRRVGGGQAVIILVHEAQSTTSVQFRLEATRRRLEPLKDRADQYRLHAHLGSTMSAGKNDPSVPDDLLFDELFTNGKLEQSTLFIDCNGDRAVLAPSCKEVFSSDGLVFEVTFGKEHLSEWSSIQTAIISLMRRFAANSKQ